MTATIQRPLKGSRISTFYPVKELPPLASLERRWKMHSVRPAERAAVNALQGVARLMRIREIMPTLDFELAREEAAAINALYWACPPPAASSGAVASPSSSLLGPDPRAASPMQPSPPHSPHPPSVSGSPPPPSSLLDHLRMVLALPSRSRAEVVRSCPVLRLVRQRQRHWHRLA